MCGPTSAVLRTGLRDSCRADAGRVTLKLGRRGGLSVDAAETKTAGSWDSLRVFAFQAKRPRVPERQRSDFAECRELSTRF